MRELDALGLFWRHREQSLSSHFDAVGCDSHSAENDRPVPFLQCRNDVMVKCHMMEDVIGMSREHWKNFAPGISLFGNFVVT